MRYWQIYLIIIGLILIYISTIVVILDWLVVNGFLILFIGLLGIVWKYVKRPPRADKYNFRETTSDNNCSKCDCFDKESFDGYEADCEYFNIKTDKDHVCDLVG